MALAIPLPSECTEAPLPSAERFKRAQPFDWGYGSTARTCQLRDMLNWKAAVTEVTEAEMNNAAIGLPTYRFREGVKIDMARARLVTQAFKETEGLPVPLQYAHMVEKLCEEMPIFIKPGELIAGDPNGAPETIRWHPESNVDWMPEAITTGGFSKLCNDEERREILEEICPFWETRSTAAQVKSSLPDDMSPLINSYGAMLTNMWEQGLVIQAYDWDVLLSEGLNARIERAEAGLAELDAKVEELHPQEYLAKRYEWQAQIRCGKAIIRYGQRLAEAAREAARAEGDAKRKNELEEMAEILEHVPGNPPRTYHEALQFYWTVELVAHHMVRWGTGCGTRMDQIWWKYYDADIRAGRITRESALELMECLFLKIQEIGAALDWPPKFAGISGASTLYTSNICGVTPDGEDATNELSFIILETLGNLHLSQPPVALQYHSKISPKIIEAAIELGRTGLGHPSYFSKELLVEWGKSRGWSDEDADKVTVCACAANNVMGKAQQSTGLALASVMNCPIMLDEVLRFNHEEERCGPVVLETGKPATEMESADEIMQGYFNRLKYYTRVAATSWNIAQQVLLEHRADPCSSLLNDETLDRGIDLLQLHKEGDTWPAISVFGGINVSNSLAAIQHLVFDEQKYTIEELLAALDADWEGYDFMRQEFINAPKYGNDDDFADDYAARFLTGMNDVVESVKDAWGNPMALDGSTASGYTMFGLTAGASPDGRHMSASLADGSQSPMTATDVNGPTAVLNSVAKVPFSHTELFNQRFMPTFLEGEKKEIFAAYLKAWYEKGNIPHIQFNVVSSETLREAQVNRSSRRIIPI